MLKAGADGHLLLSPASFTHGLDRPAIHPGTQLSLLVMAPLAVFANFVALRTIGVRLPASIEGHRLSRG